MRRIHKIAVLLCIGIMLSQCATGIPLSDLKPEQIEPEIKRLEEVAGKDGNPSRRAKTHLRLAKLYSSYKNPTPDYQQALRNLEEYFSFDDGKSVSDEMKTWYRLLNELVRTNEEVRKTQQKADELTKENQELKDVLVRTNEEVKKAQQKANELTKENQELKDALEKLKELDIKMEEKRKQLE